MSRHRIDTRTKRYAYDKNLPDTKMIENPQVESVPKLKKQVKRKKVECEPYLPDDRLLEAVNLAIALGRPLLLQGDPGCGKTRLAHSVAYTLELPLEECYIKSTSRAQDLLYRYDAVNRLYDSQLQDESSRNIQNYIHFGPLGRAIIRAQYGRRSVVLIDEIDKADLDFPNDLLLELDRLEFRVAEAPGMQYAVPTDRPELRPVVFVTHNEEKALPTAFLRRCIFHYVEFPADEEHLRRILALHEITEKNLNQKAIDALLRLRQMDLSKNPGLSELIDWVSYMQAVKTPVEDLDTLPYIGVLLKQQIDQQRAQKEFAK